MFKTKNYISNVLFFYLKLVNMISILYAYQQRSGTFQRMNSQVHTNRSLNSQVHINHSLNSQVHTDHSLNSPTHHEPFIKNLKLCIIYKINNHVQYN